MSKPKGTSPRKFAEKIALLNKKEAEATAEFEKIIKEVEQTTQQRPSGLPQNFLNHYQQPQQQQQQFWPTRSSSFSSWQTTSSNQYYDQPTPASQYQQHVQAARQQYLQQNQQQQQQQQQVFYSDQYEPNVLASQQGARYAETVSAPQAHHQQQQMHLQHHHEQLNQVPLSSSNSGQHQLGSQHSSGTMRVPNIEIFPIEDEYNSYQQATTAAVAGSETIQHQQQQGSSAMNNLTDSYIRDDCPNPSISSARSLPNIATLCVAGSPTYHTGLSPALSRQRLTPPSSNDYNVTTNTATTRSPPSMAATQTMSPATTTTTATVIINNGTIEHYNNNDSNSAYSSDQQDYCSLPIQVTYQTTINRRPSENQICSIATNNHPMTTSAAPNALDPAWQHQTQTNKSSVPNSPAHTPPILINNQRVQHQMIDTPTNQQNSLHPILNSVHQHQNDFNNALRPTNQNHTLQTHHEQQQSLAFGSPMMRVNSTTMINSFDNPDRLLSRPISNVLSKSSEACYGYLPT